MIQLNIDLAANMATEIAQLEDVLFNDNLEAIYEIDKMIKVVYVRLDTKLIAFLTFKREGQSVEMYNFGVDPAHQKQGIGTQMLNTLKQFDCILEVRETNINAINFYKNNNFYKSYIRKNYYGAEHAIVLERKRMMKQNAYAKINLVLNVVEKLENGYHRIEFLMNSVDLHDVVTVTKSAEDEVIVIDNPNLSNLDNLAYKALSVMREEFGFSNNYTIEIEKNIPVAAGMAGGSSDAAAVMRIINELEGLEQTEAQLAKLAAKVGSDVSYCIYSRLAIARGTGAEIELVDKLLPTKHLLVINPGVPLSTQSVYQNHQINNVSGNIEAVLNATNHLEFETSLENSLAVTAKILCPEINKLEAELSKFTDHRILVSGSGPTLLVFSEDKLEIEKLYSIFKPIYKNTHIAKMN
ncbi:4-(cytidine 5'-diphospho)-2-C-methyl-D-erythritol kinase [Mollicutes bacterium LVI A0039]|nr:4-(cytidine 5'-diphospho)-2-C-methyl-D-erythritol kinase [Mollicutes bacterium LVI A0039]